MTTRQQYDYLDRVILSGTWQVSSVFTDPSTVEFYTKRPDGTVTTYVYGTSLAVTRVSAGVYECEVDVDVAGRWDYRIYGHGGPAWGAAEGTFEVKQSAFAP